MERQSATAKPQTSIWIAILFVVSLLYIWISVTPFMDLSVEPQPVAALNQLVGAGFAMVLLVTAIAMRLTPLLMRPRRWVFSAFAWLALCSLLADSPFTALQRLFFTFLLTLMMSILLLMPRDKQQFARWLAAFSIVLLALCYFGVFFLSARAVHQAFDLGEPQLAGDWRGIFIHKNSAAPAMIVICIIGLFLRKTWSNVGGIAIALFAAIFLYQTNGKTAAMLLPVTLILMHFLERLPHLVPRVSIIALVLFSVFVVGSSFSPELRAVVDHLGIDSTFTGRTDIWQLAIERVMQSPIFGQGFKSFWNSDGLKALQGFSGTWAISAAHAHNAYIEALLNGGIPALALIFIWLVVVPARNYSQAVRHGADSDLNRLFGRIWLYVILAACLESSFFTGNAADWPSLLLASFGLQMQARAELKS